MKFFFFVIVWGCAVVAAAAAAPGQVEAAPEHVGACRQVEAGSEDARPEEPVTTSGAVLGRVDHEGIVTTRSVLSLGPSRWFLTTRSEFILQEEREAPAGYQGRSLSLRSPLEEVQVSAGVEAGPLILGPIEGKGIYHRLRDPTAGGVRWGALTERSRFVALSDPAIQDRRGAGLASGDAFTPVGGAIWYLERDGRYQVEGADGWLSPLPDHRLGRVGFLLARVDLDKDLLPDYEDESWLFSTPPLRSTESKRQAFFWEYDHRRREDPPRWHRLLQPRVLMEGWRYRTGTGVPRHAGTSFLQAGPPEGRVSVRTAAAEAGFRTLEGSAAAHSRLAAFEVNHRSVYRAAILETAAGWTRLHRWEEGLPGPSADEQSVSIALRRMRVAPLPDLERLRFNAVLRDRFYRWTAAVQFLRRGLRGSADRTVRLDAESSMDSEQEWRLATGFTLIFPVGGRGELFRRLPGVESPLEAGPPAEAEPPSEAGSPAEAEPPSEAASPSGSIAALIRVASVNLSGGMRGARESGVGRWYVSAEGSVPVGRRYRGGVRIRVDHDMHQDGEPDWSGLLTVEYAW